MNLSRKIKMLLVPCSGEETTQLARDIDGRLKSDYGLSGIVDILISMRRRDVPKGTAKRHTHPLVGDYFDDLEVQVDIGNNQLRDEVQGKHIVLVEHMLTPYRAVNGYTVSVNDHNETVRGFLDVFGNVDTSQITLAAPYLPYVRSHSVKKYRTRGFEQFDSLRKMLKSYKDDGLKTIVTVDPHSDYVVQLAEEFGIEFHSINPFQSGRTINPRKLGLSGDNAKKVLKTLRPFQERFNELIGQYNEHLYIVSVDDGTEKRAENFAERAFSMISDLEAVYGRLVYLDKDRVSYSDRVIVFKHFSQINADNIDPEGVYIIIDDMVASAGTIMDVAKLLKDPGIGKRGAKRVEAWTSHAVTMRHQYERANERTYIDQIVCLDTVPQKTELNIVTLSASADLLAAEIYKTHEKLCQRQVV